MSSTYNSSSVYVLECIMLYVLSAYPRSYNSDHTNISYVCVVLEAGQGFLMKVINVSFKFLKAYKAPVTLLTIEFCIEHGFNVSP